MRKSAWMFLFLILSISTLFSQEKTITFSAQKMSGTAGKKNETTTLEGDASVNVGSLKITGDKIELYGTDYRFVRATGHVSGIDSEKEFSFTSEILTYDRELEVASFQGNAKLVDSRNSVESSAMIISYNQQTEVAIFQSSVKLKRKNIDCSSGFALYRRTLSLLELSGNPIVLRDGDEFKADRITVNLDTEYIVLDGSVGGVLKDTQKPIKTDTPKVETNE